jgi:tRNA (guanine37-N1)-methyltransferase
MLQIDLISIFPEYLAPLNLSLLGKAQDKGVLAINIHDLRDQTKDVHHSVDDTPYGGGAGMVMSPVAWGEAIDQITNDHNAVDLIILTLIFKIVEIFLIMSKILVSSLFPTL